jgi:hypothetical protein
MLRKGWGNALFEDNHPAYEIKKKSESTILGGKNSW